MSIEVPITKEISEIEPKLIAGLTARQCLCVLCAAPCCWFIWKTLKVYLTAETAGFFCFIPGGIAYAFGWARPYGMKMEKFIKSVFVTRLLAPANRKYKTENTVEAVITSAEKEWNHAELMKIMETETRKEKKARLKASKSKPKYQLSPRAVK